MKARFLRSVALEELRNTVPDNLEAYRLGDFSRIATDAAHWFEHDAEIDEAQLQKLRPSDGLSHYERDNCKSVFIAMGSVKPYEARDERLWAYLTHVTMLDYARSRWPIPAEDDKAVTHIRKHFFARDKRQVERDNAASRLWWMAHLCARVSTLELGEALDALLFRSDVRANIIERPTSSQATELFGAIVRRLASSLNGQQALFDRYMFRRFMREINSVGGVRLLDCLSASQIDSILDEVLVERLELAAL